MENKTKQIVITAVIVVLLLAAVGYKFFGDKIFSSSNTNTATSSSTVNNSSSSNDTGSTTPVRVPSTPPQDLGIVVNEPTVGIYKGVVEVGASGFNKFVIITDAKGNYKVISKDFGKSLTYEGLATLSDIKSGLKNYIGTMAEQGVSGKNIHFVISSGALKNPKTVDIANSLKDMGYFVNEVTPQQEGQYAFRAVPVDYQSSATSVDIGSGNTKISWLEGNSVKSIELPGAKYYQDGKSDADVYSQVSNAIRQVPANRRNQIFIIGGVPYELAKNDLQGKRFCRLRVPGEYDPGDNVKTKSGINIYKAIYDASPNATFVFDADANFTLGFLTSIK